MNAIFPYEFMRNVCRVRRRGERKPLLRKALYVMHRDRVVPLIRDRRGRYGVRPIAGDCGHCWYKHLNMRNACMPTRMRGVWHFRHGEPVLAAVFAVVLAAVLPEEERCRDWK
jgi:hypothetical protein